jgi:hypothetical protein
LLPSWFKAATNFDKSCRSSRLTGWRFWLPVRARNLEIDAPHSAAFFSVFSFSSGVNLTVMEIRFCFINSLCPLLGFSSFPFRKSKVERRRFFRFGKSGGGQYTLPFFSKLES